MWKARVTPQVTLLKAVRNGDVATLHALLEQRGDLDVDAPDDEYGRSPLHYASINGDTNVVEMLLEADANVHATSKLGETALYYAAHEGHAQVVKLLLLAGATVNVVAESGWTPLHHASWLRHIDVIELLLEANASVDAATDVGETSLHIAASHWSTQVVELLLKANALVDMTDWVGNTPLHDAASSGCVQVVEILLTANASIDGVNQWRETPLHVACDGHHAGVVHLLLTSGANLNARDKEGRKPLHVLMKPRTAKRVESNTLATLQVLVAFGARWDAECRAILSARHVWREAPVLALCISLWAQEHADGLPLTDIPLEAVRRGLESTQAYIDGLKSSNEVVLRRKICLVGPSCAGKTSFVKSVTMKTPKLEHVDDRTIGIDHFPLRFTQRGPSQKYVRIHEVTFWDFAGQDAYQVAHSLFFSPRTLFLLCIDLDAFTVAYMQRSIMSHTKKQETQLMGEFIDRVVMKWIHMILARQPDAEFVFIITKEDLLHENAVTERLLKDELMVKLKDVEVSTRELRCKLGGQEAYADADPGKLKPPSAVFVSCASLDSVAATRTVVEDIIAKSDRSFHMPDVYTQALQAIVAMRAEAKKHDITTRINRVFAPLDDLPSQLNVEPETCRIILQTLHDLGDVLWYQDLGIKLFKNRVILDPLLLIDFIRQVINHKHKGQTMPHTDLKSLPYWNGFADMEQMRAMKQVLQKFKLVYSADEDRTMSWDSDLIVPAYWQTKTPAAWLWLGDMLRINDTRSCDGEAVRVDWEFHFEFGFPSSLFDQLVVAIVSPYFTFDAGPDWIVYEEKEVASCRIMVGRDRKSLHRTMHVEAVVAQTAQAHQVDTLWRSFQELMGAFYGVMLDYPGLVMSSFAWDHADHKIGLDRLVKSSVNMPPMSAKWMPPDDTWDEIKRMIFAHMKREQ